MNQLTFLLISLIQKALAKSQVMGQGQIFLTLGGSCQFLVAWDSAAIHGLGLDLENFP